MTFKYGWLGTEYHGKDNRRQDGSYVTTEWFCVLSTPIIPLRTVRVAKESWLSRGADDEDYRVLETLPMDRAQVRRTYYWAGALIVIFIILLLAAQYYFKES